MFIVRSVLPTNSKRQFNCLQLNVEWHCHMHERRYEGKKTERCQAVCNPWFCIQFGRLDPYELKIKMFYLFFNVEKDL